MPTPNTNTRRSLLKVWVDPEDHLAVAWLAQLDGTSVSGYIRRLVRQDVIDRGVVQPAPAPNVPAGDR